MSKNKGSDIAKILHERINKFISGEFREELREIIYQENQSDKMKSQMENLDKVYAEMGIEKEPEEGAYTYDDVDNDLCKRIKPWMEGFERWFPEDYIQAFDIYFNNTNTWDAINTYGNNISHTRHVNQLRTVGKEFSPLEAEFSAENLLKIFHEYGFDIAELDHKNNVILKDLIDYKLEHGMLSLEDLKEVAAMPEYKDKVDPEEIQKLEEQQEALKADDTDIGLESEANDKVSNKPEDEPESDNKDGKINRSTNDNPYSKGAKSPRQSVEQGGMSTPDNDKADAIPSGLQQQAAPQRQSGGQPIYDPLYGVTKGVSGIFRGAKDITMSAFGAYAARGKQAPSLAEIGHEMTSIAGSLSSLSEQDRLKAYSKLDEKTAAFNEIANYKSQKANNSHVKKDLDEGMELFKQTKQQVDDFKKSNEGSLSDEEKSRLEKMQEKLAEIQKAISEMLEKFCQKVSSMLTR
ncbi:hypothetical protein B9J93_03705 [Vibrio sp. V17_P4S1T151]|uniref:hypothetical protein n=1 Tax=unclassified Vibrio TaxID=2614977 RepID=UPI000B8E6BCA|nr:MULTISPECIES: hypothetical protein [unclassified Vibrio]OXX48868.1 hypothetical protein B9J93_03705 [Vibrio sp. V17_P4S1T151]OXX64956.1 hypothetical protein B9J89_03505 [Vibrio sp. V15_P4S5T153]